MTGLLAGGGLNCLAVCQSTTTAASVNSSTEETSFGATVANEEEKGTFVSYHQSFIDTENKRTTYTGTLYGAIQGLRLDGCVLKADVLMVDLFSGVTGKKQVSKKQESSRYSVAVPLSREIADALSLLDAPPFELRRTTNSVCTERPRCTFSWVRIGTKTPLITETKTTNDVMNFNGKVDYFLLPVSSSESGQALIQGIRAFANGHCP